MDLNSFKENFLKILIPLFYLIPVALIAFVYVNFFGPQKEVLEVKNDQLAITECLYPLKSIFNKNTLTIEQSQFIYHQRALWGDKEIKIPFAAINKITFKQGLYFYSMKLHKKGSLPKSYSVYYKDKETDTLLKAKLGFIAPNLEVVEDSSLLQDMESLVDRLLN